MSDSEETPLEKITDTVGELITGIPAPIKKNFFKAFGQLCTAAVDIPVAKLQSRASEIRALSDARIEIIKKHGEQLSEKSQVPSEYVDLASEKYASKILKEQLNLDKIGLIAVNEIKNDPKLEENVSEEEISDDWLNEFENLAKTKSSEEMQLFFAKVLAGEVKKPGSFSLKTIRILSQLDKEPARIFQIVASMALSIHENNDEIRSSQLIVTGKTSITLLSNYYIFRDSLRILTEYGLINSIDSEDMEVHHYVRNTRYIDDRPFSLFINKKQYVLEPRWILKFIGPGRALAVIKLNTTATELLSIIPKIDNSEYIDSLKDYLKSRNIILKEIKPENS